MWCRRDPILVQKTSYSGAKVMKNLVQKRSYFGAEDVLFRSYFGAEILNQVVQKRSHFGAEDVLFWSYFGAEILNQVTRWCRKDPIFGAEDVLYRYQKSGMYSALLFPTGMLSYVNK